MNKNIFKAPEIFREGAQSGICPGCGHGIVFRLGLELMEEMDMIDKSITVFDVACDSNFVFSMNQDFIATAHGRPIPTACGAKRVRQDNLVWAYLGDGAAYSIGMQHTIWAASRNENITVVVINNGVFGMTGGQMAPTTLIGQKTTSTPSGRSVIMNGNPIDIINIYHKMDIAYLARGSVDTISNINKTKQYIRKAFEKQMNGEGFSFVEVIAPCPTNWGMSPIDSVKRITEEVVPFYPLGEFIERS